ncbi:hypothetical protein KAU32_00065 [bacterium]|nr:hypothetical protein [bacterium]
MSFKGFSSLLFTVFVLISPFTHAENLQLPESQAVQDTGSAGIYEVLRDDNFVTENKEDTDDKEAQNKKRSSEKKQRLEIELETSLGCSINDPAIRSLYGKSLGTFKEHFGNVPIFGFALKLMFKDIQIKLGNYYQRSNPSYFSLYQPDECLINYTMMKYYFQLFIDFLIFSKIYLTPYLGYSYSSVSITCYDVNLYSGTTNQDVIYFPSTGALYLSFQIKYEISKSLGIFILYNFNVDDHYGKDNLSFGLSFSLL